jgi:hypothetical protein
MYTPLEDQVLQGRGIKEEIRRVRLVMLVPEVAEREGLVIMLLLEQSELLEEWVYLVW